MTGSGTTTQPGHCEHTGDWVPEAFVMSDDGTTVVAMAYACGHPGCRWKGQVPHAEALAIWEARQQDYCPQRREDHPMATPTPPGDRDTGLDRTTAEPLYCTPDVRCGSYIGSEYDEKGIRECLAQSRYLVERSDHDTSYGENGGSAEACDAHLAALVAGMIDGDQDIRAIVTIRWDSPGLDRTEEGTRP